MVLAIEKEYLLSIIPGLVKGFKDNAFAASEKLEADYEAKLEVQARSGSASGRDTFPVVVDIYGAIVKHTSYDYIGTQSYGRYLRGYGLRHGGAGTHHQRHRKAYRSVYQWVYV